MKGNSENSNVRDEKKEQREREKLCSSASGVEIKLLGKKNTV